MVDKIVKPNPHFEAHAQGLRGEERDLARTGRPLSTLLPPSCCAMWTTPFLATRSSDLLDLTFRLDREVISPQGNGSCHETARSHAGFCGSAQYAGRQHSPLEDGMLFVLLPPPHIHAHYAHPNRQPVRPAVSVARQQLGVTVWLQCLVSHSQMDPIGNPLKKKGARAVFLVHFASLSYSYSVSATRHLLHCCLTPVLSPLSDHRHDHRYGDPVAWATESEALHLL